MFREHRVIRQHKDRSTCQACAHQNRQVGGREANIGRSLRMQYIDIYPYSQKAFVCVMRLMLNTEILFSSCASVCAGNWLVGFLP